MSREISFRAWDFRRKQMVPTIEATYDDEQDCFNDYLYQENRFAVMQYTGLTDIYGVDIYEGDYVEVDGSVWEVFWDEKVAGFALETVADDLRATFEDYFGEECKVIGNKYHNPYPFKDDEGAEE